MIALTISACGDDAVPGDNPPADNGNMNDQPPDDGMDPGNGGGDPVDPGDDDPDTDPVDGDPTDPGDGGIDPVDDPPPGDPVPGDDDDPVDDPGMDPGDDDPDDPDDGMTVIDTDLDGIPDEDDECPETAVDTRVDETGCPAIDRDPPPVDGGGGGGSGGGGAPAECGNGVQEPGEDCDPPDGTSCDTDCTLIPGGNASNDSCATPTAISDGTINFTTSDATTDGPDEPNRCDFFDYSHVENDIWFCYTATCTGTTVASLCGSSFDTKLAVYMGCDCPAEDAMQCSDDTCGLGAESRVTFQATAGDEYLIRIGGFEAAQGDGLLSMSCGLGEACSATAGPCDTDNGTPGCNEADCCAAICAIDQYCCDVDWDDNCAAESAGICGGSFAACEGATGSCETSNTDPGCDDEACCQATCTIDPFCCLNQWDDLCADAAGTACASFDVCDTSVDGCFTAHRDPGCNVPDCCLNVCVRDAFCCTTEWDEGCAALAANCIP